RAGHVLQDDVAAGQRGGRVQQRVIVARAVDERGQQGGLRDGQLRGGGGEVALSRRLHAVGSVAEVHQVEVALEYLLLGERFLDRHGVFEFGDLPGEGVGDGGLLLG